MRAVAAVAVALALMAWASPAAAEQGDMILRGGAVWHRVPLSGGYGGFLSERYGAEELDLTGTALSAVYMVQPRVGVGLEAADLSGGFSYETLNGDTERADFAWEQRLLRLELVWSDAWRVAGGMGNGTLTRTLAGYGDESITADNIAANSGREDVKTTAPVYMGEVLYTLHGSHVGLELGLRMTAGRHTIPADDPRPAYSSKGIPVESEFDLTGFGYVLSLALIF